MRARQFIVEGRDENANIVEMFKKFLPLAMEVLEIDSLPEIQFSPELNTGGQPSFGMYVPDENMLVVALANRHPVDILRTVAHELVHYKQHMNDELTPDSGKTGSPQENQAHELAGVIMRNFNKRYPEYLKSKPL
jgi:Zn-dependent peptidase ImmA (M78 family)